MSERKIGKKIFRRTRKHKFYGIKVKKGPSMLTRRRVRRGGLGNKADVSSVIGESNERRVSLTEDECTQLLSIARIAQEKKLNGDITYTPNAEGDKKYCKETYSIDIDEQVKHLKEQQHLKTVYDAKARKCDNTLYEICEYKNPKPLPGDTSSNQILPSSNQPQGAELGQQKKYNTVDEVLDDFDETFTSQEIATIKKRNIIRIDKTTGKITVGSGIGDIPRKISSVKTLAKDCALPLKVLTALTSLDPTSSDGMKDCTNVKVLQHVQYDDVQYDDEGIPVVTGGGSKSRRIRRRKHNRETRHKHASKSHKHRRHLRAARKHKKHTSCR